MRYNSYNAAVVGKNAFMTLNETLYNYSYNAAVVTSLHSFLLSTVIYLY